eukprot:SAG22_NODE_394_length_11168_cov_19.933869_2_plen_171_part_00
MLRDESNKIFNTMSLQWCSKKRGSHPVPCWIIVMLNQVLIAQYNYHAHNGAILVEDARLDHRIVHDSVHVPSCKQCTIVKTVTQDVKTSRRQKDHDRMETERWHHSRPKHSEAPLLAPFLFNFKMAELEPPFFFNFQQLLRRFYPNPFGVSYPHTPLKRLGLWAFRFPTF